LQIRETWSGAELRTFLAMATSDGLCVAWRLSPYGLRRGEALSLRWSDIDFRARVGTLASILRQAGLTPAEFLTLLN
jgi:integrase